MNECNVHPQDLSSDVGAYNAQESENLHIESSREWFGWNALAPDKLRPATNLALAARSRHQFTVMLQTCVHLQAYK